MTLFASCYGKYYILPNGDAATFRNEANLSEIHCMKVKLSKTYAKLQTEQIITGTIQNNSEHHFT
jgi:hypothetical protein